MSFPRFAFAAALVAGLAGSSSVHAYYGRNSIEAWLTFEAQADVALTGNPTAASLNRGGRANRQAVELIDTQVMHLMGSFQAVSFREGFGYPGVLGESHEIEFTDVAPGLGRGRKLLTYRFKGKVVFHKDAFRGRAERTVPIKLPLQSDRIYAHGIVDGVNRCTDEHYDSEGDFWYFWDPEMEECPLKGGSEHVFLTQGRLEKLPNTQTTYPEYDLLYGDNGNADTLDVAVLIGYIDDLDDLRYPNRRDDGFRALRFVEQDLRGRDFERTESRDAFREYANGREVPGINFYRVFEKRVRRGGREQLIRVRVLLADTAVGSRDLTFHRYLVPALEESDVVIYDGHSGLGGNLDLGSIPTVRFDPAKYQIFFFNGCSSYPYFNGTFLEAKGGSRMLDVVTSGLPTFTHTAGPNMVAFLDNFIDGETKSYQRILSELERSNGEEESYLTGVNGDEDNRWTP